MKVENRTVIRNQYKNIAKFLGYEYIPLDTQKSEKQYPGWFKSIDVPMVSENANFKLYNHKSPCFVTRKTLDLNFKYDWNNLMKVVEKIEKLKSQQFGKFKVIIQDDGCIIQATNRTKENTYSKSYYSESKINSVYSSILLFIEWFNNNKKL